jgi:penicillin-insensitive murein endopeptidase
LCRDQDPAPPGDGCGQELSWWLSDEPWKPASVPTVPPKPILMAELPAECRGVLEAR